MNCIYAGAFIECGRDLEQATRLIDRIFRLRGTVLPSSNQNRWLSAVRENSEVLYSEAEIVELRSNVRIKEIFLTEGRAPRDELARLPVEEQRQYLAWHHATPAASPGVRACARAGGHHHLLGRHPAQLALPDLHLEGGVGDDRQQPRGGEGVRDQHRCRL